jgi:hypothetical protein
MSSGFFSSRGRALKFPEGEHGTTHTLFITTDVVLEQQEEGGKPLFWDEAKTRPKEQAILSGYVDEELTGPNDDGYRTLYVRGGIQKALSAACRRAEVEEPGFGMKLILTYTHDGTTSDPERKPPKEFFADLELIEDAEQDPRFRARRGVVPATQGG